MIGPSKSKQRFISFIAQDKLELPYANPSPGSDLPGKPDKSYSCKFVLIPFLISLCLLHLLLFNHAEAKTNPDVSVNSLIPKINAKIRQYPKLICGVYIKPSWTNKTININGEYTFPAASLIKIPVAVALLRKIDKGQISWNKVLVLKPMHYAQGAGILRTRRVGSKFGLREVFRLMLTISDNTATNMIIDLLGGIDSINREINSLGLKNTKVNNYLGDFKGTNKTSPKDLVLILDKSLEGNILSNDSKKILKGTLLKVQNKSLIKKGLGKYTRFAHKTGTIGICVGDAGIIYSPLGKRICISVIVRRPFNSLQGQKAIREITQLVKEHLM